LARVRTAIVVAIRPGADTMVAGLPLGVRCVLALREAGFDEVLLIARGRPRWAAEPLARRGVTVRWIEAAPESSPILRDLGERPVLLLAGDVLVDGAALVALRDAGLGPISTEAGHVVGEVCPAAGVVAALERAPSSGRWPGDAASSRPSAITAGVAMPLTEAGSAAQLERMLLEHLGGQTGDSYLATLVDRRLSRPLTRLLLRTPLAPWHVTVLSMAIGIAGAVGLMTGSYWPRLGGVLLLIASLVLDCVDGELARARLAQSRAGARLDVLGDYVVNLAVFAGLAVGLLRGGLPRGGMWAALALVTGVGAAMTVVHALFVGPALRRGGDLHWTGDASSLRGRPGAAVVERLASRDYTYLLLILALLGHLEWFLYTAAAGAWLFTAGVVGYALIAWSGRHPEVTPR
jgi:phosphatidylglycerophosphate synthase